MPFTSCGEDTAGDSEAMRTFPKSIKKDKSQYYYSSNYPANTLRFRKKLGEYKLCMSLRVTSSRFPEQDNTPLVKKARTVSTRRPSPSPRVRWQARDYIWITCTVLVDVVVYTSLLLHWSRFRWFRRGLLIYYSQVYEVKHVT